MEVDDAAQAPNKAPAQKLQHHESKWIKYSIYLNADLCFEHRRMMKFIINCVAPWKNLFMHKSYYKLRKCNHIKEVHNIHWVGYHDKQDIACFLRSCKPNCLCSFHRSCIVLKGHKIVIILWYTLISKI